MGTALSVLGLEQEALRLLDPTPWGSDLTWSGWEEGRGRQTSGLQPGEGTPWERQGWWTTLHTYFTDGGPCVIQAWAGGFTIGDNKAERGEAG